MAFSTEVDYLARQVQTLIVDNEILKSQVASLLGVISPTPSGASVDALYGGKVQLDRSGITLPLTTAANNAEGIILWRNSTYSPTTFFNQAQIVGYALDSTKNINMFMSIEPISSLGTVPTTASLGMYGYGSASTNINSSLPMYVLEEMDVADVAGQSVWYLYAGRRFGPHYSLIEVVKNEAGLTTQSYSIGIQNAAPSSNTVLDIGGTKPMLIPRLTTAQRDAVVGANGMLNFNATSTRFEVFAGGAWRIISSA